MAATKKETVQISGQITDWKPPSRPGLTGNFKIGKQKCQVWQFSYGTEEENPNYDTLKQCALDGDFVVVEGPVVREQYIASAGPKKGQRVWTDKLTVWDVIDFRDGATAEAGEEDELEPVSDAISQLEASGMIKRASTLTGEGNQLLVPEEEPSQPSNLASEKKGTSVAAKATQQSEGPPTEEYWAVRNRRIEIQAAIRSAVTALPAEEDWEYELYIPQIESMTKGFLEILDSLSPS